jgi:hypothetical protein
MQVQMPILLLQHSWYSRLLHFIERHMLDCPSRKFLHMQCPGCGFQRSCVALLRGHLRESFLLYPATIPILLLLFFLLLHLKYRFANGALVLQRFYVFCAFIVVISYIHKIATHQFTVA